MSTPRPAPSLLAAAALLRLARCAALCTVLLVCGAFPRLRAAAPPAADVPLVAAVECRPRAGWPNFFAKAAAPGAALRIAYFGGSITAQPGWRPKSLAYFQKLFPAATFTEINAAIGGTGSDLGVFRIGPDVLDHRPDLVLVEFATNDGGAAPGQILRCMEGIVRQTWRRWPDCDIGFVYTVTEAHVAALLDGKFQRAASVMEKIADHYGLPTVHLGLEVAALAKAGRLRWKAPLPKTDADRAALGDAVVFAPDGVHPHPETGHELYLATLVRSIPAIRAAGRAPGPHALPAPHIPDHYERARLVSVRAAARLSADFVPLDAKSDPLAKRFANRLPALVRADRPGAVLTFRFKGTRCAIYDLVGPDGGQVRVTLDDGPPVVHPRFDSYCTYHRLQTLLVGTDLPDTEHTVKIELLAEAPDKAAILAQRNQKIDDPARYAPLNFYPGAILVVGEVLP